MICDTEIAHHRQHLRQAHTLRQRLFACLLDDRAVGTGVGEGNPQLDDVAPAAAMPCISAGVMSA